MKKVIAALIIMLISISPLFRGLYFDYETYGFMAAIALLCILYFFINIITERKSIRLNKLYLTAGVLMLAGICFSFANAMNRRATLESLFFYMELLVVFIVLYDHFYGRKLQFVKAVMLPCVVVGAVAGFVGMMALTGRFNAWQVTAFYGRIGSTFQYANTAALYFLICFIFAITLASNLKRYYSRSIITGLGSVALFAFYMTGSRGGLVIGILLVPALLLIQPSGMRLRTLAGVVCSTASVFLATKSFNSAVAVNDSFNAAKWIIVCSLIAAVTYYAFSLLIKAIIERKMQRIFSKKSKVILAASVVVVLLIVLVFGPVLIRLLPPVMSKRLEQLLYMGFSDNNIQCRFGYYRDAMELIASHWLFGLGGDGWKAVYQSVQDFGFTANHTHNQYLQIFVDHGILAFLSYAALVVISAVGYIYSYVKARDKQLRSYITGMMCGFIALSVHSSFDFDLVYASMALLFWTMFAVSAAESSDGVVQESAVAGDAGSGETVREALGSEGTGSGVAVSTAVIAAGAGSKGNRTTGLTDLLGFAFRDRWKDNVSGNFGKLAFVAVCALLFSTYSLYFAAAYNGQKGQQYKLRYDYINAVRYYEEAYRLDPSNSNYAFELAKTYLLFGRVAGDTGDRKIWFEKARIAGEISVKGNKGYPPHMNTLVRIYLDSGMPLEALDMAENLVFYQKFNAEVYELLAKSYIDAAAYYENNGDVDKAKELLAKCVAIDNNPHLRRSIATKASEVNSPEVIARYKHSERLSEYLMEAEENLKRLK
jgi:tetratricopeptide (TPR) repeat protein